MRKILTPIVLLSLLLAGCSPAGGPSQSQSQIPTAPETPYPFINLMFSGDPHDKALLGPGRYEETPSITDPSCLAPSENVTRGYSLYWAPRSNSPSFNETVVVYVGTYAEEYDVGPYGEKYSEDTEIEWWIVASTVIHPAKKYFYLALTDAPSAGEYTDIWLDSVSGWSDEHLIALDKAIGTAVACLGLKALPSL